MIFQKRRTIHQKSLGEEKTGFQKRDLPQVSLGEEAFKKKKKFYWNCQDVVLHPQHVECIPRFYSVLMGGNS